MRVQCILLVGERYRRVDIIGCNLMRQARSQVRLNRENLGQVKVECVLAKARVLFVGLVEKSRQVDITGRDLANVAKGQKNQ